MKTGARPTSVSANRLREDFDRSFAEKPREAAPTFEDFLAVRIGGDAYAIRLSEVSGLHRDRKIVPVTTHATHLLGIAGFRGTTAPIYDLREILGHSGGASPRWLVLARAASVGFAFDVLEKHLRIEVGREPPMEIDERARRYVRGMVRTADGIYSVIELASVIETITQSMKV